MNALAVSKARPSDPSRPFDAYNDSLKISILIASRNRSQSLSSFLRCMETQVVPAGVLCEILVVDNGSCDETRTIVSLFQGHSSKSVRYIFEPDGGKSCALNTGIRQALGDILVFTDDDCIPDSNWLSSVAREFQSDPSIDAIGGRVELFDSSHLPLSIRTSTARTIISDADQLFSLLIGCNMAARRQALYSVGNLDPFLGPGTRVPAMEDLDLLYRMFHRRLKIVYSPDVVVYHNHGRSSSTEAQTLNRNYIVGRGSFYCKHIFSCDTLILKRAFWETRSVLRGMVKPASTSSRTEYRRAFSALAVGFARRLWWNRLFHWA